MIQNKTESMDKNMERPTAALASSNIQQPWLNAQINKVESFFLRENKIREKRKW